MSRPITIFCSYCRFELRSVMIAHEQCMLGKSPLAGPAWGESLNPTKDYLFLTVSIPLRKSSRIWTLATKYAEVQKSSSVVTLHERHEARSCVREISSTSFIFRLIQTAPVFFIRLHPRLVNSKYRSDDSIGYYCWKVWNEIGRQNCVDTWWRPKS